MGQQITKIHASSSSATKQLTIMPRKRKHTSSGTPSKAKKSKDTKKAKTTKTGKQTKDDKHSKNKGEKVEPAKRKKDPPQRNFNMNDLLMFYVPCHLLISVFRAVMSMKATGDEFIGIDSIVDSKTKYWMQKYDPNMFARTYANTLLCTHSMKTLQ